MNSALENKLKDLPRTPGVYFHKSKSGEIIYVGKAAVLKNRVKQYFQSSRGFDIKTLALVREIYDTDWVETDSEIDALFLESEMVKRYMPRYNILLRDDKSQIFIRIDMKNEWPYVCYTRNPSDDGAEYFGPFYSGVPVKKALRYLRRVYPYLTKPPEKRKSKLDEDLGLSPNFDAGPEAYKKNLRKLVSYIRGNRVALMRELEQSMKAAAKEQRFEEAVSYRNKLSSMKELQRRVMFGDKEFLDISKDKALTDLAGLLGLSSSLKRIEGYDISHMGGTDVVASMVVFTNGVSDRAEYRKFKAKLQANNDTQNMFDTLCRRLSEKNLKAWGAPDLLLIDGGKGQLDAAIRAQRERGTSYPVISIAKREEEIIVHWKDSNINTTILEQLIEMKQEGVFVMRSGNYYIVNLHAGQLNASAHSKNLRGGSVSNNFSDVVKLFQRIRDESHRFAVSYHTVLKRKKATASTLDELPGIGPATRKRLLKEFGSLKSLLEADQAAVANIVGIKKAQVITRHLGGASQIQAAPGETI